MSAAPIAINNAVSRTCVPIKLPAGIPRIDIADVKVIIRPRRDIGCGCEPKPVYDGRCNEAITPTEWIEYPAHNLTEDGNGVCFHWDSLLWNKPPGRYMATVYVCGCCVGCFQMQVGKRVSLAGPATNILFNPCDATVDLCSNDVTICE